MRAKCSVAAPDAAWAVQTGQQFGRDVRALTQQVQDRSTDVAERLGPARVRPEQHEVRHQIGSAGRACQRDRPRPRHREERSRFTDMFQHGLELADRGFDAEVAHRAARQPRAAPVVGDRTAMYARGARSATTEDRGPRRSPRGWRPTPGPRPPGTRLRVHPKRDRSLRRSGGATTSRRWTVAAHRVRRRRQPTR